MQTRLINPGERISDNKNLLLSLDEAHDLISADLVYDGMELLVSRLRASRLATEKRHWKLLVASEIISHPEAQRGGTMKISKDHHIQVMRRPTSGVQETYCTVHSYAAFARPSQSEER